MAKLIKLQETKTYATEENAIKAFQKFYGEDEAIRFFVMRTAEGRFFPVALLHAGEYNAVQRGVHFNFHVLG